jgi:hypothetical protein
MSDPKKICAARHHVVRHGRRDSGIATFSAVVMLTIVMIAVTSLTHYFAQQARYTRDEVTDAQLRQLLLVGEQYARANTKHFVTTGEPLRPERKDEVPLPRTLREAGASLCVERLSFERVGLHEELSVRVTASLGDRQMSQVVGYSYSPMPIACVSITDARLQSGRKIPPASR